jgi:hypothetical protein
VVSGNVKGPIDDVVQPILRHELAAGHRLPPLRASRYYVTNGGFNIMLQAFPLDGKIVCREITEEQNLPEGPTGTVMPLRPAQPKPAVRSQGGQRR